MIINESLAPGDILEIDSETGVVIINGNEVFDIEGEVFDILPGANIIQYSDNETSRDLSIEIKFTERYI